MKAVAFIVSVARVAQVGIAMHACGRPALLGCLVFALGLSAACSPALPLINPEEEIANSVDVSEEALYRAERYAREARVERERAERLLDEAREVLLEVEKSEKECKRLVGKVPKKPKIIYLRPKKKEKEKEEEEKPKPKYPEYSESDAPLEQFNKEKNKQEESSEATE